MSDSLQKRRFVSPGTVISVLAVFLYCAGFIRTELKLEKQNKRIETLEKSLAGRGRPQSQQKTMRDAINILRHKRAVDDKGGTSNSTNLRDVRIIMERYCSARYQACPPSPTGPRGMPGPKGDRGDEGRTGKRGPRGMTGLNGPPGARGPLGMRGSKGNTGDAGPRGMPGPRGPRGEPGQSATTPHVIISPLSLTVKETDQATFYCSATGNPQPVIVWTKVNGSLGNMRTEISSSGRLKINNIQSSDGGSYQCEARSILGVARSRSTLVVHVRPQVSLQPGPVHIEGRKTALLPNCLVTGNPPPNVTWSKVPGQLPVNRSVILNGQLSLMNVQKSDSGLYTCRASNLLGTQAAHTQLVVVFPPQFDFKPPSSVGSGIGQTLQINCSVKGDLRTVVTWRRVGGQLPVGRAVVLNGNLILRRVTPKDSGTYICKAARVGLLKLTAEAEVTVTINTECSKAPSLGAAFGGKLPNSSFTASSQYDMNYLPQNGRLNRTRRGAAWCTRSSFIVPNNYLQVDLGAVNWVCGVATQGNHIMKEWVTRYKLTVSTDGVLWNTYQENGISKEFTGNIDHRTIVKHVLSQGVNLRFIRFVPTARNYHPCMRVDVYGWKTGEQ